MQNPCGGSEPGKKAGVTEEEGGECKKVGEKLERLARTRQYNSTLVGHGKDLGHYSKTAGKMKRL